MAIILITGGARSGKSKRAEMRTRTFPGQHGTPDVVSRFESGIIPPLLPPCGYCAFRRCSIALNLS